MTDQIFYTEGAGNTFLLSFNPDCDFESLKAQGDKNGIYPDGYILAPLESEKVVSFNFYNKDKSLVDFCGNALRAVGLCFKEVYSNDEVTLKTAVGPMRVKVLGANKVKAQMPEAKVIETLDLDGKIVKHVLSGVPHLVFSVNEFSLDMDLKGSLLYFSENIRKMNLSGKETYNLTYYDDKTDQEVVSCVTFERGVEGFTEACGSGALSVFKSLDEEKCDFKMPGGALHIKKDSEGCFMTGPAKILKRIEL